jgi:hypothetical protein
MSFTDIANRALLHLGVSKQLSANTLSTSTRPDAVVLYSLQNTALKKTLIAADWDFATWIADLTLNTTDPDGGVEWPYAYDMPESPECVKPRHIVTGDRVPTPGSQIPFRVVANIGERFAITGATAASPVVISAANHTISNTDTVYIEGVVGMTNINQLRFTASAVVANTSISLSGINGTAYTAYTSGGYISRANQLIYTDEEDAALEYTYLVTDTDQYPEEFKEAMACMWAYLAAPGVTGGDPSGLGGKAFQLFEREISKAIARDGNKRQFDEQVGSEFTENR